MMILETLYSLKKNNRLNELLKFFETPQNEFEDSVFSVILKELFNYEAKQIKSPTSEMIEFLKDMKGTENEKDYLRVRNILIMRKV